MRLYGLRNEQGRDVELVISDEGHPHHHVMRVEVLEEASCERCKHYIEKTQNNPCDLCMESSLLPFFTESTPTKGK
jgi:uncharacterized paraquat-inducible protein A